MPKPPSAHRKSAQKVPQFGSANIGEQRVHIWINAGVYLALERLAKSYGVTKKEMLERLIVDEEERVLHKTNPDSPEGQKYLGL